MRVFRNRIGYAHLGGLRAFGGTRALQCCTSGRAAVGPSSLVVTLSLRFASLASVALWLRVRPRLANILALYT